MDVDGLAVRRSARAEQRIDKAGEAIGFADDDIRVLGQLAVAELSRQKLCGSSYAAERVLDLVGELPDHLPACTVLDEQRILAADPVAACDIGQFNEQHRGTGIDRRDTAVHDSFVGMDFRRAEVQLVGVVIAGAYHSRQDVLQLGIVIEQSQQ